MNFLSSPRAVIFYNLGRVNVYLHVVSSHHPRAYKKVSVTISFVAKGEAGDWLWVSSHEGFRALTIHNPRQEIGGLYPIVRFGASFYCPHLVRPSSLLLFGLKPNSIDGVQEALVLIKA